LYSQFICEGDICFDVGANIGNRVEALLDLKARVVAFEPQSSCCEALNLRFCRNPDFVLEPCALGHEVGQADLMQSDATTISSMSAEWIKAVQTTGRFTGHTWDNRTLVNVDTLDRMIVKHGIPKFIKIDVEGFEYEVLRGLSRPVSAVSLEFTPEFLDATYKCITHLASIGEIVADYSIGESMTLCNNKWQEPMKVFDEISALPNSQTLFGDIYIIFPNHQGK